MTSEHPKMSKQGNELNVELYVLKVLLARGNI